MDGLHSDIKITQSLQNTELHNISVLSHGQIVWKPVIFMTYFGVVYTNAFEQHDFGAKLPM